MCDINKTTQDILTHLKHHAQIKCSVCGFDLAVDSGNLALGEAQMVLATCANCKNEDVFVMNKNGELFSASPSLHND